MPKAETLKEVNTALGQVVQAVADCTITPHEAQTMVPILEVQCRALKTADPETRICALERKQP